MRYSDSFSWLDCWNLIKNIAQVWDWIMWTSSVHKEEKLSGELREFSGAKSCFVEEKHQVRMHRFVSQQIQKGNKSKVYM